MESAFFTKEDGNIINKRIKWTRGTTKTIEGKIRGKGLVEDPLPSVKLLGLNVPDGSDLMAQVWIPTISGTVTLNELIGGFDIVFNLLPTHTEERKQGDIIYYDIQFVQLTPLINQTWKGSFVIEADINLINQ